MMYCVVMYTENGQSCYFHGEWETLTGLYAFPLEKHYYMTEPEAMQVVLETNTPNHLSIQKK